MQRCTLRKVRPCVPVFLVLCLLFTTGHAYTVNCCNLGDIASAIASAADGATITVAPGTFSGTCSSFNLGGPSKKLTLAGASTTILCSNPGNLAYAAFDLTGEGAGDVMTGINIRSSNRVNGTGLIVSSASVKFNTGLIDGFTRNIIVTSGTLEMNSVTVSGGQLTDANSAGAGLLATASSLIKLTSVTFSYNVAPFGAALHVYQSTTAFLVDCYFNGNTANNDGGAIYNQVDSYMNITTSTFSSNSAGGSGGSIFNYARAILNIMNSKFTYSSAGNAGSLCSQDHGQVFIRSCDFSYSQSNYEGGTLRMTGGSLLTVVGSTFQYGRGNVGAFLYIDDGGVNAVVQNSNFTLPPYYQDAYYAHYLSKGGPADFQGCNFTGGYAAIYLSDSGRVSASDSYFTQSCYALFADTNYGTQPVTFQRNVLFQSGKTGTGGGAVTVKRGDALITDNVFRQSSADNGALSLGYSSSNVLRNTFVNNFSPIAGAGVFTFSGSHIIQDCTFIGNSCPTAQNTYGGAICTNPSDGNQFPKITVSGCTFTGNSALQGGAISVAGAPQSSALIVGCSFYNHLGSLATGGVLYASMPVIFRDSYVDGASANTGGVVSVYGGFYITVANITVKRASAIQNGGVINSVSGDVTIANMTFAGASALNGGAVYSQPGTLRISNVQFLQNTATLSGGAIAMLCGHIMDSVFSQNSANVGGAISGLLVGNLDIMTTSFTFNSATVYGGAVATSIQGAMAMHDCVVDSNVAGLSGGGVFTNYVCNGLLVNGTSITNNRANFGGGVYVSQVMAPGKGSINSTVVSGNSASFGGAGGGLYLGACTTLLQVVIEDNLSSGQGGGIYAIDAVTIVDGQIAQNSAAAGGGIYCRLCAMTLSGGLSLSDNSASDGGGFWCNLGSVFTPAASVQFTGNTQSVNPSLSSNCQCGCCAEPVLPASVASPDCLLAGGRVCEYSCGVGYSRADENGMFTCLASTSITPSPLCLPNSCDPVIPPANCSAINPTDAKTLDTATFYADFGFTMVGNPTVTCYGPNWVGPRPVCKPDPCSPALVPPDRGSVSNTTGVNGDRVNYYCDLGFTRIGPSYTDCTASGTWSNGPPTCQAIGCDVLPAPGNGTVFLDPQPATGAVAYFACNPGYALIGTNTLTCLGGNWTTTAPTCQALPCLPVMTAPTHGAVANNNGTTGMHAEFTCDDGYYVVGLASILCFAPNWQGSAPLCEPVFCNTTQETDLVSGCPTIVAYGTQCSFQCVPGTSGDAPTSQCAQTPEEPRGTFLPALGLCSPCNAGSFSGGGAVQCTACPNSGTTATTRATSQTECLCAYGFYEATPGAGDCVPCPEGGACPGGKVQPTAAPGYFKNAEIFSKCSPAVACTGANQCGVGYEGFACGSCQIGFYRLNGYCYPCPNDGPWRIILLVIFGLVAVRALIEVVKPESVGDRTYGLVSINIALSFLQIVATFSDLRIRWPPATRALYDAFSLLNLNIEIVNPECVAPLTFWDKIEIQLLMPIIVLGMFLIVWFAMVVVYWIRNKHPGLKDMKFYAIKTGKISAAGYMFFMILAYLFLAKAALTLFACNYEGGNVYTLALAPSNLCYEGKWLSVAPLAVFGIIAYIVAVPIVVHAVYLRSRRQYGAAVATNSLFSNFLVAKFRSDAWYWENAIMLRKLLMVIVATFGIGDSYSQVAASFAVMLVAVLFSLPLNPYRWRKHNLVENATLFSALAVLFCGLLLSSDSIADETAAVGAIDALAVVAIFASIIAVLGCLALEIRVYYMVLKLKKELQPEKVQSLEACNTSIVLVAPYRGTLLSVSDEGSVLSWHIDSLLPARAFNMKEKIELVTVRGPELYFTRGGELLGWDLDRQASVETKHCDAPVTALASANDFLFTGHETGDLIFWPFRKQVSEEEMSSIRHQSFSRPMNNTSVSITDEADKEGVVLTATASSLPSAYGLGEPTRVRAHGAAVTALKSVGLVVYSADRDGCIRKWSHESFKCFRQWQVPDLPPGVFITAVEEVTARLVVGTSDGVLRSISVDATESTATVMRSTRWQIQRISHLALCNGMLLSASADGRIIVLSGTNDDLLQMLPDCEASVTALTVLEDGTVVYGDSRGILRKYHINPEWHMKEGDPHLLTLLWGLIKERMEKAAVANVSFKSPHDPLGDADAQHDIYDELSVLAQSLDLPAIPWRVLDSTSAEAVALALAGETQKRRDHSDAQAAALRKRQTHAVPPPKTPRTTAPGTYATTTNMASANPTFVTPALPPIVAPPALIDTTPAAAPPPPTAPSPTAPLPTAPPPTAPPPTAPPPTAPPPKTPRAAAVPVSAPPPPPITLPPAPPAPAQPPPPPQPSTAPPPDAPAPGPPARPPRARAGTSNATS